MIYCVVPEVLAGELYDKLVSYYETDTNVQVIVDRRRSDRRRRRFARAPAPGVAQQRQQRDRRRARVPGEFLEIGAESVELA